MICCPIEMWRLVTVATEVNLFGINLTNKRAGRAASFSCSYTVVYVRYPTGDRRDRRHRLGGLDSAPISDVKKAPRINAVSSTVLLATTSRLHLQRPMPQKSIITAAAAAAVAAFA